MKGSLKYVLCDLWGNELQPLYDRWSPEVVIAPNEPRTAKATISVYDDAAFFVTRQLDRILKVFYPGQEDPIFTGILHDPDWDLGAGTVTLNATDGWFRLDRLGLHTYLNFTDKRIAEVYALLIQYGATKWLESPYPLGITAGADEVTGLPNEIMTDSYPPFETNIGGKLRELLNILGANDLVLTPLDRTDGYHWQLDTPANLGEDRSEEVYFHFGTGLNNCISAGYAPAGSNVINSYWSVGPVPSDDPDVSTIPEQVKARARVDYDIDLVGLYEAMGTEDSEVLGVHQGKAGQMVTAYHEPPQMFSVTPAPEGSGSEFQEPPEFIVDYFTGDVVSAHIKRGALNAQVEGRITKTTVGETPEGNVKVINDIAPNVGIGVTVAYS